MNQKQLVIYKAFTPKQKSIYRQLTPEQRQRLLNVLEAKKAASRAQRRVK